MKGCGGVSGELELIPQHFSWWQIDGERQTTATTEGIFSLSMAAEITVMAQGFKPAPDKCPSMKPHSAIWCFSKHHTSLSFLLTNQNHFTWQQILGVWTQLEGEKVVNSTSCSLDWLILEQPWGGRRGLSSYELPLHIASQIAVQNATAQVIRTTRRHGGEGWNLQLAGRWEDRFASQ